MARQDMKRKVCGVFPDFCYKAYGCEDHQNQFMNNSIFRLNCRYYCRHMDETRRDLTEGVGITREPGKERTGWVSKTSEPTIWTEEMGHPERRIEYGCAIFLFCMSLPNVNLTYMKERFGRYIVKINEPGQFAEDIKDCLEESFRIEGCEVVYNKGQKLDRALTNNERVDLSYRQKDPTFSEDCEFRIVVFKPGELCEMKCEYLSGHEQPCNFIEVNLGKQLDYASLINL